MRKMVGAHGGCLGTGSRRRTRQAAIIRGEGHKPVDPRVSEWENPARVISRHPPGERIARGEATRGTETSKYPEEEKSNETPPVAASERGRGQTGGSASPAGVVGPGTARLQRTEEAERHGKAGGTGLEPRTRIRGPRRLAPEYRRTRETRWEAGGTTLQA